jgi:VWFA-related protein
VRVSTALIGAAAAAALAAPQQQPPVFRGGVDVIQVDVAVLDSQRRPVGNLTAGDFTILEDGKPQPIVSFQELTAPDPDGSLVPWMREVAPDVTTNSADGRRIFVLLLDDASLGADVNSLRAFDSMRKIADAFVDRLGPLDEAAIVFSADNHLAQDFTGDHAALHRVIASAHESVIPGYLSAIYSAGAVRSVCEALVDVSHRRKAMIYIGTGLRLQVSDQYLFATMDVNGPSDPGGNGDAQARQIQETKDAIVAAQRANVAIYTMNPRGLQVDLSDDNRALDDASIAVANQTGGFAVTNTNSFDRQVTEIFRETGLYYLLGFRSAYRDGKLRRIDVKVDKPGLVVRTRNGYYAPKPDKASKPVSPLAKAMTGLLPDPDMYMRTAIAPLAAEDHKTGAIITALGLTEPAPTERQTRTIDLLTSAYTREGKFVASRKQTAQLTLRPSAAESDAKFEIISRLDLKPGRYDIRYAVHDSTLDRSGSIYADVDVPDFSKERLALSGAIVSVAPGLVTAGGNLATPLVPHSPTTQRSFASSDDVVVFVRAYQGGTKPPVTVTTHATITDEHDTKVLDSTGTVDSAQFGSDRSANVSIAIPASTLKPGSYLLSLETSIDPKTTASRGVRFSIR